MSDFSLTLVLRLTTSKIINDVAKVQIKSEKITPFGGIFHVRELFSRFVGSWGSTDHFLKFLYYTSFLTPHSICIFYVRDSLNSIKTNTIFVFSL